MTAAETRAINDLRQDVRQLEAAIDGDQGLRVRVALLEQEVKGTREEMRTKLEDLCERVDRLRTPPPAPTSSGPGMSLSSWRAIGALLGGFVAAAAAGGGLGFSLAERAEAQPPAIEAGP